MYFILNGNRSLRIREFFPKELMKFSLLAGLFVGLVAGAWAADPLGNAIDAAAAANKEAAQSQKRIDALAEDTQVTVEEYRQVIAQADDLKAYNDQIERLIRNQKTELESLTYQSRGARVTPS